MCASGQRDSPRPAIHPVFALFAKKAGFLIPLLRKVREKGAHLANDACDQAPGELPGGAPVQYLYRAGNEDGLELFLPTL